MTGRAGEAAMSPMANTSGWPGIVRSAVDDDAPALRQLDAEHLGERAGAHAGRPHDDTRRHRGAVGQVDATVLSVGGDAVDADARPHLDATARQRPPGALARLGAHRPEQSRRRLDEDHPCGSHVERGEVLGEHPREQLHHRPGGLDAGRPAAAHDDVELAARDHRRVGGGPLEALQHGEAQVEGVVELLEGDGVLVDTVDAERVDTAPAATTSES